MNKAIYILFLLLFLFVNTLPSQSWNVGSLKEYVDVRFDALDKAVNKADAANEKRFENTNEWRNSINDIVKVYVSKSEYESNFKSVTDRLENIETKLDKLEGTKVGSSVTWSYIVAVVSVMISIISFGIMIYNKKLINKI